MEDDSWIVAGDKDGWVANFFRGGMRLQKNILYDFPESERMKGYGYAAKVIIDGPGGGIFLLWFNEEQGIAPKPASVPIRNTLYGTTESLLDIITPDIKLEELVALIEREGTLDRAIVRLRPRLDPRTAFANGLFWMADGNPDIDSEMWSKIWERFIYGIAFPLTVRTLLKKAKPRRSYA